MRLVPGFLTLGTLLGAQAVPRQVQPLPWEAAPTPAWVLVPEAEVPDPVTPLPEGRGGPLRLGLTSEGRLRVVDARGTVRLSLGLPGRPGRAWRDGGRPLEGPGPWAFPDQTPLQGRKVEALLAGGDARPGLEGLAWFLDDGERCLTLVHPATGRAAFLRLPEGEGFTLSFHPGHLELREGAPGARTPGRRWRLPWLLLLPHLGTLLPAGPPSRGTALVPFPRE